MNYQIKEAGKCPKCKSENIDYHDSEEQDNSIYYEMYCNNCGTYSKEWYTLNFIETVSDE